ncbi:OLC1v1027106C1 [Oldenlandia corymbosa var. corymbosa]|uniref:OLC1v1027106C1 n=1 Tax=Oldenlandia corymbosa var. corymbosa TaxID=529605 RepID=A0AAV1CBY3_OLDCO|nr:OLC1v1027106C1 [Oldenlandia corymbosa var. corymbosa]
MNFVIEIKRSAQQPTSAEIVASIDDILQQILLGLPIKSLVRFKSVSKHWISLISNPQFAILHGHNPKPPLGLFLQDTSSLEYLHCDPHNPINPPLSTLEFIKDPTITGSTRILQSCNGLLLCSSSQNYYVFNPTTKQFRTIPTPSPRRSIRGVGLAFDPVKSPVYKVVCIRDADLVPGSYQIEIYSSDNGCWRVSGQPFPADHDFKHGVYCNGAINWLCNLRYDNFLYFNVDEERLGEMPPLYTAEYLSGDLEFFGESGGHLHLIEVYGLVEPVFTIHEMKRDYSGWFPKYEVDISAVARMFPEMIQDEDEYGLEYFQLSVLAVIREEKEEDAFVVLQIPGKAIRYNLVTKTFHKLCDFVDGAEEEERGSTRLRFDNFCGHHFIESLSCV